MKTLQELYDAGRELRGGDLVCLVVLALCLGIIYVAATTFADIVHLRW